MPARRSYAGGAVATTITGSISSTDLSCTLADATGWPVTSSGECFVTFGRGTASEEKALATRSGSTLTFASLAKRGVDGTTAAAHAAGTTIEHTFSALDADEANDHTSTTGAVHTGASLSPGTLIVPTSASPAQTTDGSAVWDSDDNLLTVGTGAGRKTLVDTDSTQTMAGKTLTTPTIGSFVNATHTHSAAASGGLVTAHGARVYRSTNQSATSGANLEVLFDTEDFDTDGYHSTVSNTGRITVPAGLGGIYLISATLVWDVNATGVRQLSILKNGVTGVGLDFATPNGSQSVAHNLSVPFSLAAGDYVTVAAFQNSGGALNVLASSTVSLMFSAILLGA